MEIESIQEADEDQEVEKYENHNANSEYAMNRLETEYVDDDEQAYDLYSIEEVFSGYVWNALTWIITLLFALCYLNAVVPAYCLMVPLVLLEFKYLVQSARILKEDFKVFSVIYKSVHFIKTLDSFALLLAYCIVILWWLGVVRLFSYSVVPVVFVEVLKVFFKSDSPNSCVTFSRIVHSVFRWGKLMVHVNLCVKVDRFLVISWVVTFWPVFAGGVICLVVAFVLVCMCLVNVCGKNQDLNLLYSHCWLLYGLVFGPFTFVVSFFSLERGDENILILPVVFLLVYLVITIHYKNQLTLAWWEFFVASNLSQNPYSTITHPLPLPNPQKQFIEHSLKNKLTNVIKKTPLALVKLSNPSIQSRTLKMQRKKVNRTLSQAIDDSAKKSTHLRSQSSNNAYDFSVIKPLCKFCSTNEALNKFKECGHGELCNPCGESYLKTKSKCYVCHEDITGIVNEYAKKDKAHIKRFSFSDL